MASVFPETAAQDLPPRFDRVDVEFDLVPEVEGSIPLNAIVVELLTSDGARILTTLTSNPPNGLTVNDPTGIAVQFATDMVDSHGKPIFSGPGIYQFEARDTTVAARDVVAWGHFKIRQTG
jgi:hypothetical protein